MKTANLADRRLPAVSLHLKLERDALATRVRILEAALECIQRETELALHDPSVSFVTTQRIGSVARQSR